MAKQPNPLVQRVNAFLGERKSLLGFQGMADWVRDPGMGEERAQWPLLEGSTAPPDSFLAIVAHPHAKVQTWSFLVRFGQRVMGLDHVPQERRHTNPLRGQHEGLPYVVEGPHVHLWADNVRFATPNGLPPKLLIARPLPPNVRGFHNELLWFCAEANILFPTHEVFDLPRREQLL